MPSLTSLFWASLAAMAAATALTGNDAISCIAEEPSEALLAANRELAAMDRVLARRHDTRADSYPPLSVDVYAHVFVSSNQSEGHLSRDSIDAQIDVLNRNFKPAYISFVLVDVQWTVDAIWAANKDSVNMRAENHRGGSTTLNLYFVEQVGLSPMVLGVCTTPESQFDNKIGPGIDGCTLAASTAPGGPALDADEFEGKIAVHEVGHWFGLLHPFGHNCSAESDLIEDTPVSLKSASNGCLIGLDSCPGQPGLDAIHNHMSYTSSACRKEFTPGQVRRMHQLWNLYRFPHRDALPLTLSPQPALRQEGKLPYYPEPSNLIAMFTLCLPDRFGHTRELREEYCGSSTFCYFGVYKLLGLKYDSGTECLNARGGPR